ncbi:secondary thiamine-phosphate synthase enzyme YjbQ [Tsuneonella amylolytica]|uniref:secondary thiamine-phosphate synthase enzyme YjbQ n=1 Tax=Tsuneonella amylolytica TaxID=2338327 RepID=UPI000EA8F980|nr:secondary thiamine-phosphate synthase enzyme YjbQ [Tsuneonella amylolytica]
MTVAQGILRIETAGQGLTDITARVAVSLAETRLVKGSLSLFCRHTSAGLLISENASPAVQRDLLRWLDRSVPEGSHYEHDDEGPDDMPAHVKAMLTGSALTIPFAGGRMLLGTWQAIYLAEHRARPQRREVVLTAIGA